MTVASRRNEFAGLLIAMLLCISPLQAGSLQLEVTGADGEPLAHAVAYVKAPGLSDRDNDNARPDGEVDQRNQQFLPHSQAIQRGTSVRFPNSDQVRHHVFSFSEAKTFELPLYAGEPPEPVHFDTAGVVVLGCNIHDHMIGYLLIVDTPVFGSADGDGVIRLSGVPDHAEASLRVWHPELGEDDMGMRVDMDGTGALQVNMDVTDALPPEPRGLRDRRRGLQDRFD